jgi:hypothetical protein
MVAAADHTNGFGVNADDLAELADDHEKLVSSTRLNIGDLANHGRNI